MSALYRLLVVVLMFAPCTADAARHALLIGMGAYPERGLFQPLTQPEHDVEGMRSLLSKPDFGFEVTVLMDLSRERLDEALQAFYRRLRPGDTVLLYYSGHGVQIDASNFLVPVGAPFRSPAEVRDRGQGAISATLLINEISDRIGSAGIQIAILDACRNDLSKGGGGGLAEMSANGVLITTAASPGQRALATGPDQYSVFTHFLLEKLAEAPRLRIRDVLERVTNAVYDYTREYQWPWMSGNLRGRFCLQAPCLNYAVAEAGHESTKARGDARSPVSPRMTRIEGGCFEMGQSGQEKQWLIARWGQATYDQYFSDEQAYRVCVDDFELGTYEVSVGEFARFVQSTGYVTDAERNPSEGCYAAEEKGSWTWVAGRNWRNPNPKQPNQLEHAVGCVSYSDAVAYTEWLSNQTGSDFRLPTEAEFEYANRAGSRAAFPWGDAIDESACRHANVAGEERNSGFPCQDGFRYVAPVGQFEPNSLGLYDMAGNQAEWTCSLYSIQYGRRAERCAASDEVGPRVLRGGSWDFNPINLRAANRYFVRPDFRNDGVGFRVARRAP
ncbi:MAG: SUMF1/EgtB/PvdO family nonheme iron enzyme [Gammaproteobacteria bacterium]|nr:SUMF1/EgtB/PvdO family nonheme iron enzyme [Gammaproteobacteria bacterium]